MSAPFARDRSSAQPPKHTSAALHASLQHLPRRRAMIVRPINRKGASMSITATHETAFPILNEDELTFLRNFACCQDYSDGDIVFRAGDADIDFFVVESGFLDILNPTNDDALVTTHTPGQFSGDIDLLTRRPVIVTGVVRGPTRLLRVPGAKLRELLNRVPRLGEKLIIAFQGRRELLSEAGVAGLRVFGPGRCRDTTVVREFLHKNFVP